MTWIEDDYGTWIEVSHVSTVDTDTSHNTVVMNADSGDRAVITFNSQQEVNDFLLNVFGIER